MEIKSFMAFAMLAAFVAPAHAETASLSPNDTSGQYARLHPLAPPSPGSIEVLPAMPAVHTQSSVAYISGGIGGDEQEAMRAAARNYNLHLLFAEQGSGEYLSDIKVTITNPQGAVVLSTVSSGPYFMARLPAGHYRISADAGDGRPQMRVVTVPEHGALAASFYWHGAS
ncbi:MAG TPA: carboxypeptidase-like regulatory domain-containing protein [Stellaceae bacterium]|nr:carboxypeptidase-like regulatory domain-containing protein [Stellaceae bacterium]